MAPDHQLQSDVRRYYETVSEFMDAELEDRGDEDLWRAVGLEHRGGSILEVGCGSGRVTKLLAAHGARVLGIDLSPELLRLAATRVGSRPNVQLLIADMRDLALRARFDIIVAPDDPFSHLTTDRDRDRALCTLAAHLADGGRLLVDALWFSLAEERRGMVGAGRVLKHDLELHGQCVHVTERWLCDAGTHRCSANYEYAYDRGTGKPAAAQFEARYWSPQELRSRLTAAGLAVSGWWGGYHRQPWDARFSQHLVVEAKRVVSR